MYKSVVSITKGSDAEKLVHEALSLLGGVENLIKPNSSVVVKPNAGHWFPPETSVCTSPAVVSAVIKELRKAKPKEIILAESAAIGADTMKCLEISGIGKAAEEAGVDKILDIKSAKDLIKIPIRDAKSDLKRILLPRFIIEADHIINVPIFKPNMCTLFTCALKNLKGLVQDKVHYEMHATSLTNAMIDLCSVAKVDLNIIDMIRPAEGFGPHCTLPIDFGCIVAGRDPVAVDSTICRMVGIDIKDVQYLEQARERGLGNYDENSIEIRGKTINQVFKELWIPFLGGFTKYPEYHIYSEYACSSCQSLMGYTMERLKAQDEYDKNAGISIVFGRKKSLPVGVKAGKNLILVGDCVKKYRDQGIWIAGCPPIEPFPIYGILDRIPMVTTEQGAALRPRNDADIPKLNKYMYQEKEKRNRIAKGKNN